MNIENNKSRHVLIVEDNEVVRRLLSKALTAENYNVDVADEGSEALRILSEKSEIDLVLLDLLMPKMNGDAFMRNLRAQPNLAHTKVIIVSGWDDLAKRTKELGADGYIKKPVDLPDLYEELDRHFSDLN